jgi:DNA invertase Pin-like site-specific DNA recombinase
MVTLGYTRVSTTEQAADGRSSLSDQERRIRGAAMMRGADEVMMFSDPGVSGSIPLFERKAGRDMAAFMVEGNVLIAAKLDRLFRSAADALTTVEALGKKGVDVILTDLGPDPVNSGGVAKVFFTMMAAFSEFERNRISERMSEGKRAKAARGGAVGGKPPYGMMNIGKGREAIWLPDPDEQRMIQLMHQLSATRSLRQVAAELARRGLYNRDGATFSPETVKRLLARPVPQVAA